MLNVPLSTELHVQRVATTKKLHFIPPVYFYCDIFIHVFRPKHEAVMKCNLLGLDTSTGY